jgi:hypothetical protein
MKKTTTIGLLISLAFLIASCGSNSGKSDKQKELTNSTVAINVLKAGVGAKTMRFENMHQTRFIEFFFAMRDSATGKMVAPCFNSMYTSALTKDSSKMKDTSPQNLVEGLDMDSLAKEYGVLSVFLNGPKLWMPDWVEVEVGEEIVSNGITLGWCAQLALPENGRVAETPYEPMKIARTSKWGWKKGQKTILLDDSEGNTWVLKGFQLGLKPVQSYDEFLVKGADNFKNLPAGWKVRVTILPEDLIEIPATGVATIMTDEMQNVWDMCGPGMTNYVPKE